MTLKNIKNIYYLFQKAWKDVSQFMEDESVDVVMILGYVIRQGHCLFNIDEINIRLTE